MKQWIFISAVVLLLLGACQWFAKGKTINDALDEIERIDQKYALQKASFHDEELIVNMVDFEAIPDVLKDLNASKASVVGEAGEDKDLVVTIYQAREQMLNSEYLLWRATKLGKRAFVNQTIICNDKGLILEGEQLLRESIKHGMNATENIDAILQQLTQRQDDKTKERIGISKTRPRFYFSEFQSLANQAEKNRKAVEKYC